MDKTLLTAVFEMIRALRGSSRIKVRRYFDDFFADRLTQAFTGSSLVGCIEHLSRSVDASMERIRPGLVAGFISAAGSSSAPAIMAFIRQHPRVVAMIAAIRDDDDFMAAVASVDVPDTDMAARPMIQSAPLYDIAIDVELLAPLAHGADGKAGNATLFRRRQVLAEDGSTAFLPYYSGNAVRGQMRDLLADHFLSSLGLSPRRDDPPVKLWFFHALYAGGVLEESTRAIAAVEQELGRHGAVRTEGLRRFRDMIPPLSLLGCAIGNRVIPGRVCVGDLRPRCLEWGLGAAPASGLMDWVYLTRRDDHEGRTAADDHTGMIAVTECLREGVGLVGGIDMDTHAGVLDRSALGLGLELFSSLGILGAESRRGLGKARIEITGAPDPVPYTDWLSANRDAVLEYLDAIGALA